MTRRLGIGLSRREVAAVLVIRDRIEWAGRASYETTGELSDIVGRLAAECGRPVGRAQLALDTDIAQIRCIDPAPPLKLAAARRHVALQSSRIFRNGHGPLQTDAQLRHRRGLPCVLVTAAVPLDTLRAVVSGCEQAGIRLDSAAPSLDLIGGGMLRAGADDAIVALTASGTHRLERAGDRLIGVRRCDDEPTPIPSLFTALQNEAHHFVAAYAAAVVRPGLDLLPGEARHRHEGRQRRRIRTVAAAASILWISAAAVTQVRWHLADQFAATELSRLEPRARVATRLKIDLDRANAALGVMNRAQHGRSQTLELLSALTTALGDSVTLASVQLSADSTLHLSGYAPSADRVVASLEHLRLAQHPKLEGPATRQQVNSGSRSISMDRFAISARLASR